MDLTLKRIKTTSSYTYSRLYDAENKQLFNLDIIEPPVEGLSGQLRKALPLGQFKIFLKPEPTTRNVVAVMQKICRSPRCGFSSVENDSNILQLDFHSGNRVYQQNMFCGRFDPAQYCLSPAPVDFDRFMIALIIAKTKREVIRMNIK